MKVVLFCGGRGIRLRELSEAIPKPMVTIGYRPILWHVMRYYAHFGHRDFILCLGYRADAIKEYFLRYEEALSNDFVLSDGGRQIELLGSDIQDWRITFADTGLDTTIGERLSLVRRHLEGEELFLANYGDTLTDAPLDRIVADFTASDAVASFLSVRASVYPFRLLETDDGGRRPRARPPESRRPVDQRRVFRPPPGRLRYRSSRARSWSTRRSGDWRRRVDCGPFATTVSGRRWTRSGTSRSSRSLPAPAARRGCLAATWQAAAS